MDYSDWVESNGRVWLHDSMTALGQFAYVNPIMRAHHWYNGKKKRCYKNDYEKLVLVALGEFEKWKLYPAPKRGEVIRMIAVELRKYKYVFGLQPRLFSK